jgi:hypothetical protein
MIRTRPLSREIGALAISALIGPMITPVRRIRFAAF